MFRRAAFHLKQVVRSLKAKIGKYSKKYVEAVTAIQKADVSKFKSLLEGNKKLVNYLDKDGDTLLHFAVAQEENEGNIACVELLFEHGANIRAQNNLGHIPAHVAIENDRMLHFQSIINKDPNYCEHISIITTNRLVDLLVQGVKNFKDYDNLTLLREAINVDDDQYLDLLVSLNIQNLKLFSKILYFKLDRAPAGTIQNFQGLINNCSFLNAPEIKIIAPTIDLMKKCIQELIDKMLPVIGTDYKCFHDKILLPPTPAAYESFSELPLAPADYESFGELLLAPIDYKSFSELPSALAKPLSEDQGPPVPIASISVEIILLPISTESMSFEFPGLSPSDSPLGNSGGFEGTATKVIDTEILGNKLATL